MTPSGEEAVLSKARMTMAAFRQTFGCDLRPDTLAEVYVARHLSLTLAHGNNPGFDATAQNGDRYQVKHRAKGNIIDTSNFDFDYMVLVAMDGDYQLTAIYRITREQAQSIFVRRVGKTYRRWQTSQAKFIAIAERIA